MRLALVCMGGPFRFGLSCFSREVGRAFLLRNCRWAGQGLLGARPVVQGLHAEAAGIPHQAILGPGHESFGALGQQTGKGLAQALPLPGGTWRPK